MTSSTIDTSFIWYEIALQAINQIRAHFARSLLTSLGILISVCGIVTITGVMDGLDAAVNHQFLSMGNRMMTIQGVAGQAKLGRPEYHALESHLKGIRYFTATQKIGYRHGLAGEHTRVTFEAKKRYFDIVGTSVSLPNLLKTYPTRGRFILETDVSQHLRVCVISQDVIDELGLPSNPLGQVIQIGGNQFEIVGTMPRFVKGGPSQLAQIYLPLGAHFDQGSFAPRWTFSFELESNINGNAIHQDVRQILRSIQNLSPNAPDSFSIKDAEQQRAANLEIMQIITTVLTILTMIASIIGAIGIMNVMLVAVTQRTKEIGIMRALGATAGHIQLMFLTEAAGIACLGAALGIALGLSIANLIAYTVLDYHHHFIFPGRAILLSVLIAFLVGIICGVWPAARAARLDPIDALARE